MSVPLVVVVLAALGAGLAGYAVRGLQHRRWGSPDHGELERLGVELAASRDRFRTIVETMTAGVVARDVDGGLLAVNSAARRLLGVEDREGAPASAKLLERLPLLASTASEGELALDYGPGPPRTVSVLAGTSPDGARVVVLHDITEQRRTERIRRDFVANASHELRTPVAVLQANAETLLDGALEDPAAARGFVEGMDRHARRLSALLGDLLDLSRIEAGSYAVEAQALDVAAAFERARDALARRAGDEGVAVEVDVSDGLLVKGDLQALDQVLVNLIDNALKYSPADTIVRLVGRASGPRVRLEVRDAGPGIAEEQRARLFERFYRVDPGRDRSMGGTGLGLAIVKHLSSVMGGTVGMEPNAPRGSVFWVSLPAP